MRGLLRKPMQPLELTEETTLCWVQSFMTSFCKNNFLLIISVNGMTIFTPWLPAIKCR